MVGGKVIETIDTGEKVWVNCQERTGQKKCAIYIERTYESRAISDGDSIWWQGGYAFWTPKSRVFVDKKLKRIGFSGVNRPH
jgi:hypothetical protein